LELNQENLTARANLRCNQDLLAGRALDTRPGARELEDFGKYRNWLEMQLLCGPCDEPAYLCRLALTLEQLGLWRQAGQSLERVAELAPNDAKARLELANVYAHCRLPEPAFQCIEEVRTHPDRLAQINSPELTVTMLTAQAWYASSWYASSNRLKAESVLHSFIERHLTDPELLDQTRKVLLENQSYELAGWTADLRLQISPEALPAMMDKALCHMRLGQFSNSIPVLTHVLSLTNSPEPLLFRAEAYIGAANLDAAAADFQELLRTLPGSAMAYEGLAEVARRKGATNEAIGYYQQCLANAASGSDVARIVSARLRELQPQR
jgi:tetratricopeptide (TPR) repeat protein